jgi:hypothetical protein
MRNPTDAPAVAGKTEVALEFSLNTVAGGRTRDETPTQEHCYSTIPKDTFSFEL